MYININWIVFYWHTHLIDTWTKLVDFSNMQQQKIYILCLTIFDQIFSSYCIKLKSNENKTLAKSNRSKNSPFQWSAGK